MSSKNDNYLQLETVASMLPTYGIKNLIDYGAEISSKSLSNRENFLENINNFIPHIKQFFKTSVLNLARKNYTIDTPQYALVILKNLCKHVGITYTQTKKDGEIFFKLSPPNLDLEKMRHDLKNLKEGGGRINIGVKADHLSTVSNSISLGTNALATVDNGFFTIGSDHGGNSLAHIVEDDAVPLFYNPKTGQIGTKINLIEINNHFQKNYTGKLPPTIVKIDDKNDNFLKNKDGMYPVFVSPNDDIITESFKNKHPLLQEYNNMIVKNNGSCYMYYVS